MDEELTPRQQREREYHRQYASERSSLSEKSVDFGVVKEPRRRWWNAYWSLYTILRQMPIKGARVLVPGCGFGEDAIRLAILGAEVYTFDLSPDVIEIARQRANRTPYLRLCFDTMPAEKLRYPDNFFDLVLFVDILHHVEIPAAMNEIARVLKPGGKIIGDELYTHSSLQKLRESGLIVRFLYPRMRRFIYGTERPYITEDEHKINEREFAIVKNCLMPNSNVRYFNFIVGRLLPSKSRAIAKLDRLFMLAVGPLGRIFAGRIVFTGTVRK